ncbi:MAG: replication-associated recombination protein A [Deltaproteobacteria bacterium]|nr:replication-associated recombination protein A [Deltaproteobacteria bacterium]
MTGDLFAGDNSSVTSYAPLADRMRPRTLDEVVGQTDAVGPGTMLQQAIAKGQIPSVIFWGPPGSGKTSLARVIANSTDSVFVAFSAVLQGVKEIRQLVDQARARLQRDGKRTILFVDEIHRFNKSQQDSFLPHVENGTINLIGATTENPSFEVNAALLSRCRVVKLLPLTPDDLRRIVEAALSDTERGLGATPMRLTDDAMTLITHSADGDARRALNAVEILHGLDLPTGDDGVCVADLTAAKEALQQKSIVYDKTGEMHYDVISAFIKSVRGSDPDAALYYLARMIEAGEDAMFIARRLVILASEDIGNADLRGLPLAVATMQATHMVGLPEARINLAQCTAFLACAPKSNRAYMAFEAAHAEVKRSGALEVPLAIRNAPTKLMKELGYHKGYQYDHDYEHHHAGQQFLPDELTGTVFYDPSDEGQEKSIRERLEWLRARAGANIE